MLKFFLVGLILAVTTVADAIARPLVIAHRGASGYLPEHTLETVALAHGMGVDFIEQDVVLTKDGVPVVLHDVQIDTVTDVVKRFPERKRADGRYYAIDFTLAEIKQLRVSERFNFRSGRAIFPKRFPVGKGEFRVPTLEEELQLIQGLNQSRGLRTGIYVELKQPEWHREQGFDLGGTVLPLLARYGYAGKGDACFVQCFELEEIRRMRGELAWKGRMVLLFGGVKGADGTDYNALASRDGLKQLAVLVDGVGPAINRIVSSSGSERHEPGVSELVAWAHAAGLVVHPYTVRADELPPGFVSLDALHSALFAKANVDGVFTDFPDLTIKWLESNPRTH
ncbi:glycerophosphodiester phosphodiesterase [Oleiharenicola lentus]|uniref:glycerophosphodiester phosphodiesterase n=1 Tax=Oleiharenicola lentus TaxID=2508720 RepID=UPI003F67ECF4